jgi:hypothetical protein
VFHSPQPGHLPRNAGLAVPHCWQIQLVRFLAISLPWTLNGAEAECLPRRSS